MVEEPKMNEGAQAPTDDARKEAKQNPGGWVYKIAGDFGPEDAVPPEAIVGAWQVDDDGNITGEFIPNPNYPVWCKK